MRATRITLCGLLLGLLLLVGCGKRTPIDDTTPTPQPQPKRSPPVLTGPPDGAIEVHLEDALADAQVKDTIVVRGDCTGVENQRVRLVSARHYASKRSSILAPDLVMEYKANAKAADERYRNQVVSICGVVAFRDRSKVYLSSTDVPGEPAALALPDRTQGAADFTLTPEELSKDFEQDAATARAKYQGKIIEIAGKVSRFENGRGNATVLLAVPDGAFEVRLRTRDDQPWASVFPGQEVTLRGRLRHGAVSPDLDDCVLTKKSRSTPKTLSAVDLSRDFSTGTAGNKKHGNHFMIVGGTVARVQRGEADVVRVYLQSPGKPQVCCQIGGGEEDFNVTNLKPGTVVKVFCRCPMSFDANELLLEGPLFIFE